MDETPKIRLVILGGGKGGTALLNLLGHLPAVEILGIADKNPAAPALSLARALGITVVDDVVHLIAKTETNLIVDVTGDPTIKAIITAHKSLGTEVLGGAASKLLWNIVQHDAQMQTKLFQTEKLASIGTFSSGIAHDINNPLYLIMGLAENLLDETDTTRRREQTNDILGAVKRIATICQNLTHYARQSTPFDTTNVELNGTLDEALTIAHYATTPKDLSIVKDYANNPVITAKPEEMLQVFVNLMTNAIHAMEGKGHLTLLSECQDGIVRVSIRDTGCGIPPESLEKIFDPFYTTKQPGKGTGLGLHSVKTIVNKNHGQLSVSSTVGQGSNFQMEFPSASPT